MTQEEIIQGNKLIAEFMGWSYNKNMTSNFPYGTWIDVSGMGHCAKKGLFFHSSWDWLMPVVEKIRELGFKFIIGDSNRVTVCNKDYEWRNGSTSDTLIQCVYHAVIQFINWYNQQPKQ